MLRELGVGVGMLLGSRRLLEVVSYCDALACQGDRALINTNARSTRTHSDCGNQAIPLCSSATSVRSDSRCCSFDRSFLTFDGWLGVDMLPGRELCGDTGEVRLLRVIRGLYHCKFRRVSLSDWKLASKMYVWIIMPFT